MQSAIGSGDNRVSAGIQVPLHHLILIVLPPCVFVLWRVPSTLQVMTVHFLVKVKNRTASTGWNLSTLRVTASLRSRPRMMWCPVIKSRKCRWIICFPRINSALKKTTLISTTWWAEDSWFSGQGYAYWHFTLFSQHRDTQRKGEATPRQSVCDFYSAQTCACFPVPGPAPSPQLHCFVILVLT